MKTNLPPIDLENRLKALEQDFALCSFDVSSDGTKAIILGFGQDPDFPQLFIYWGGDDSLVEIDSGSELIDVPLGRAFWDKDNDSILLSRWDRVTIYKVTLSNATTVGDISEVQLVDEYIEGKLAVVDDFLRPREITPVYESEYEKWVVDFIDAMATFIRFQKIGAIDLSGQERIDFLAQKMKPFEYVLTALGTANEKNEMDVDLDKIRKAISF